ncbi:hypothetical protein F5050DRAFT_1715634 [Lentinula boryana]|uniref:Uncharacterized protein n=1 Tax=Lentinula boryana TaxID=40481 RepID=A0ABQ8Q058_9AGAR|nr:hypothetical protein F5050DRAFT_1715634 [Lentinula boryana]
MSSNGNLNVIIDSAKNLFYQIAQLEPPGPNASPRSKKRFHKMIRTVSQASGQTYDVAVGIGQSIEAEYGGPIDPKADYTDIFETNMSDGDEDNLPVQNGGHNGHGTAHPLSSPTPTRGAARPYSSPTPTYVDMASAVFSDITQDERHQYDIAEFSQMVVEGGHRGKAQDQEYEAIRRALVGYKLIPCQEILKHFLHISAYASTLEKTARRALAYDRIEDIGDRLSKRERIIFNGSKRDKVSVYVFNIVRNIEGIKA